MALTAGTRLGAYEILALIGAGGMGEVYRARDTRLHREVALKVLPELFAADPDRLARFKREAQLLASLNHPNIAAIYGLEEGMIVGAASPKPYGEGGRPGSALVLELVEGPTLADRIAQGPIPLDEALPIARQIAEALEAAHEQGVIHRDLKPANIKVRPDGTVKVLDFGLAKAFEPEIASGAFKSDTMSPTITSPVGTRMGIILGTAAYMSPEQARGKTVDKRSDIWAFGCVLYEMLTGRRPFEGEEVTDVLARVLERDPDFKLIAATIPPAIRRLLRRCLEKDRKRRLTDIGVARLEIDEALVAPAGIDAGAPGPPRSVRLERLLWTAAIAASVVVALAGPRYVRSAPVDAPEMRLQIDTPQANLFQSRFAISPDGRAVVFRSLRAGTTPQLWIRSLASEAAEPLAGTDNASGPFWSPDGRAIGFFANGELKRVEVADGRIRTIATPSGVFGGAWNAEGSILFTRSGAGPLYRVAAEGGEVTPVTRIDPPRTAGHISPQFLPDGRHFLFFAFGSPEGEGVYLGSLDAMETTRLVRSETAAVFTPPDLVLFEQEGALVARRLNLDARQLEGDTLTVARQVAADVINAYSAVHASGNGAIAYRAQPAEQQLVWFDRGGRRVGELGGSDAAQPVGIRIAPDGRTVALSRTIEGNADVWLMDTARATLRRLTLDPAGDGGPIWSADGSRIVFHSDRRAGNFDLYEKQVNSAEPEKLLLETQTDKNAFDWSADGRFILYRNEDAKTGNDVWALPLFGDRKPLPIAQTTASEIAARFSPDGQWVAFQSNESGRTEIYAQSFPEPGARLQISNEGGVNPQWRGDGRELFYLSPDDRLMASQIRASGSRIEAETPVPLFSKPQGPYAASSDGQRFLVGVVSEDASPITILLNWAGARR